MVIAAVWVVLAFVVNPIGEFPLDDDWAYVLPVKALLESGTIRFTDWNAVSLIGQMLWGSLFSWPVGYSITALRISTLTAGLVGLVALYLMLRSSGARRTIAVLGALTLAGNPLFYNLSCTFMSDVPSAALMVVSAWLLIRGMGNDSEAFIWSGVVVCLLSLFVRQISLAILIGFAVAYPLQRGFGVKWLVQAVAPVVVGLLGLRFYASYLISIDQLPRGYYLFHEHLGQALNHLAHLKVGALKNPIGRSLVLLLYVGFFLIPIVTLLWPGWIRRMSRRERRRHLLLLCGATALVTTGFLATGHLLPLQGQTLNNLSLGTRSVAGQWPAGLPTWFWSIATLLGVSSATIAVDSLIRAGSRLVGWPTAPKDRSRRFRMVFLVVVCVVYFGPVAIAYHPMFDRYFVGLVPFAIALVVEAMDSDRAALRPGTVILAAFLASIGLAFGVAATHDYLAWNRVRWDAAGALLAENGLELEEVDGGWEFNNYYPNMRRLYLNRAERDAAKTPSEREQNRSIERLESRYRAAISPLPGHEVLRRYPISRWLPTTPAEVFVLKRTEQASAGDADHIRQEREHEPAKD